MADSDKRQAKRVSYPCEAECYGATSNPLSPRISDLSVTGAFIDSMIELPVGSRLTLKFSLPTAKIEVTALVVHSMPHFGMGVQFVDLADDQRQAIEKVVQESS